MKYIHILFISVRSKLFVCKTVQLNKNFLEAQEPVAFSFTITGKITP